MGKKSLVTPHQASINEVPHMSENERERITEVFKMYETDVRSATINPEVSFIHSKLYTFFESLYLCIT